MLGLEETLESRGCSGGGVHNPLLVCLHHILHHSSPAPVVNIGVSRQCLAQQPRNSPSFNATQCNWPLLTLGVQRTEEDKGPFRFLSIFLFHSKAKFKSSAIASRTAISGLRIWIQGKQKFSFLDFYLSWGLVGVKIRKSVSAKLQSQFNVYKKTQMNAFSD